MAAQGRPLHPHRHILPAAERNPIETAKAATLDMYSDGRLMLEWERDGFEEAAIMGVDLNVAGGICANASKRCASCGASPRRVTRARSSFRQAAFSCRCKSPIPDLPGAHDPDRY
jgi:hypothetical protein